jgi:hypothetical protein
VYTVSLRSQCENLFEAPKKSYGFFTKGKKEKEKEKK